MPSDAQYFRRSPRGPMRWLLRGFIVFIATYVTGALGFALPALGARLTLPLLPSGIAVGATYRWGRGMLPAIFLAGFLIDLGNDWPVSTSLWVGAGLAGGSFLTEWLLRRWSFDPAFARARDVPVFLAAALIGMTVPPTLGQLGFLQAGLMPLDDWLWPWSRWWGDTTVGVLLMGPLLLALTPRSLLRGDGQWLGGALWLCAFVALAATIFVVPGGVGRAPVAVIAMTLVVIAAIHFGLVAAAAGTLGFSVLTAFSFAFDKGAFGGFEPFPGLVALWSFVGALVGLTLIITALLAERDTAASARLRAERRYAEIFEASPQPMWVHDPVSLRVLLANDAAVLQYGWSLAELTAREITLLAAPGGESVVPPRGGAEPGTAPGPFETRHATRDGRVLDVEVWTRSIELGGESAELVFAVDVTERRALSRALLEAISGEQRRIGQDMHDGLGQELTGLALTARALEMQATRDGLALAGELGRLADLASECIESTRRIVRGLSPLSSADGNLPDALEALARTSSLSGTDVHAELDFDAELALPLETRSHLLRIAQEAVQNALKHAHASTIEVQLSVRPGLVTVAVEDDGTGLAAATVDGSGLGMRTMRFRAAAIGGRLSIAARPGGGTRVACEVRQAEALAASA